MSLRTFILNLSSLRSANLSLKRSLSSKANKIDLRGVYPPIVTPFSSLDESIDYDKLQENFKIWNNLPFRGVLVEGSNGEYVYLTNTERIDLVKKVKEILPEDNSKLLLAGSGCESTKATIEMSAQMHEAGADAVMVVTPCYYKGGMKDNALYSHYKEVADNSPAPVILYSVPANTGIDLSPDVIVDLASHPNIIGMKDSGGDITKLGSLVHRTKSEDFQILAGSAGFLFPALQLGCVGGVCALANVLGEEVCKLQSLYESGDLTNAALLQHKLITPNAAITKIFGVAGLKQTMDWKGLYGGPTRKPLLPLSPTDSDKLKMIFSNAGYL